MAERSKDDLNETPPSREGDKNPPSAQPKGGATTEEIGKKEDVIEDERINDRFQATDN
jgi:hypothetical protein